MLGSVYSVGVSALHRDVRFAALPADGVPTRSGLLLKVDDVAGGDKASPSQKGFLMMYRDAALEAETVTVTKLGK